MLGISVVLTAISLSASTVPLYLSMLQGDTWERLSSAYSAERVPYYNVFMGYEIASNAILVMSSIVLVYLFFSRRKSFPKLYIVFMVATVVLLLLDIWFSKILHPTKPMFNIDNTVNLIARLIALAIWLPYLLTSKRVKATFIRPVTSNE